MSNSIQRMMRAKKVPAKKGKAAGWGRLFRRPNKFDLRRLSAQALKDREAAKKQKSVVTTRISETTRTLAFGSLASCYALLLANKELAAQFASARPLLLASAALGIAAIMVDAAQYVFGYINVEKALQTEDQRFPRDWSRRARTSSFFLKQGFAYAGALLLLFAVASRLI